MSAANQDHNDSSWDLLASELGLDDSPSAKRKPLTEDTDEFEAIAVPDDTIEIFPPTTNNLEITADSEIEEGPAPEEMEESAVGDEEAAGLEEAAEGQAGGRRRRRRRRRKKGGEPPAGATAADAIETPVAAGIPDVEGCEPPSDEAEDDIPVEIVGEAAEVLEEDDEEDERPVGIEEELEDDSAEPLPDMKVVAWTDLIATLYRPQDR